MNLRSGRQLPVVPAPTGAIAPARQHMLTSNGNKKRQRSPSASDDEETVHKAPPHKKRRSAPPSIEITTSTPSLPDYVSPQLENPGSAEPTVHNNHTEALPSPESLVSSAGGISPPFVQDSDEATPGSQNSWTENGGNGNGSQSVYLEDFNINLPEQTPSDDVSNVIKCYPAPTDYLPIIFTDCKTCDGPLWLCDHGPLVFESPMQSPKSNPTSSQTPPSETLRPSIFDPLPSTSLSPSRASSGSEPHIQPHWSVRTSKFWPEIYHYLKFPKDEPHTLLRSACGLCKQSLDIFGLFKDQSSHRGRDPEPAVVLPCGHIVDANCMHAVTSIGDRLCPVCSFDPSCTACQTPALLFLPTTAQGPRPLAPVLAQTENLVDGAHPASPAYCSRCNQDAHYLTTLRREDFPSLLADRKFEVPLFRLVNNAFRNLGVASPTDDDGARAVACAVGELVENNFRTLLQMSQAWDRLTRAEEDPWAASGCDYAALVPRRDVEGRRGRYAGLGSEDAFRTFMDSFCEADRAADRARAAARDAAIAERIREVFEIDFARWKGHRGE